MGTRRLHMALGQDNRGAMNEMAISFDTFDLMKVLVWSTLGFVVSMAWTPLLTNWLYKHKMWRKQVRQRTPDGYVPTEFQRLHADKEVSTPRLGGLLIWVTTITLALIGWLLQVGTDSFLFERFDLVSRNQTWLPLFSLLVGSLIGLADDLLQIFDKGGYVGGGMKFTKRLGAVLVIAAVGAWWFWIKLGNTAIFIPWYGDLEIGWLYPVLFFVTMIGMFGSGVVDGLDGLAGGVFAIMFGAFGTIALVQQQYDIAALCGLLLGTTLAFLWFNIPPARFYMSETGSLGITVTLTIIAFLTNAVFVLPIIGFVLVMEVVGNVIQLGSKRLRHGKKVFRVAPIHHHFEAIGWSREKVVMRFWIISTVMAVLGVAIHLLG